MEAVAVTCVVARGLVDAWEALSLSLPGPSRPAVSVAVNAVCVVGRDAGRPSAYAEGSHRREITRLWIRCYSPRVPHGGDAGRRGPLAAGLAGENAAGDRSLGCAD